MNYIENKRGIKKISRLISGQKPNVRAKMVKAIIGINQQKKVMMKQRLTSSVSIFFISPYLVIRRYPRAAIPTTTIDQPTINHMKKSDKETPLSKKNLKQEALRPWSRLPVKVLPSCALHSYLSRFDVTEHVQTKGLGVGVLSYFICTLGSLNFDIWYLT